MINNQNALEFFSRLVQNAHAGVEKYGHDTTTIDAEFIRQYLTDNIIMLDLGTGSGLIINKIGHIPQWITAIEPFQELSNHIHKLPNLEIKNVNIFDFEPDKRYDLITLFGFMHYFNLEEAEKVYQKCFEWLKPGGKIIVKNQFGLTEDVNVAGYSNELKTNYFAQYRFINTEKALLASIGFDKIEVFDIYPPECNRWENTHFYAIVAEKPN